MVRRKENPENQMMTLLILGGGGLALYWYLTSNGPNGAVATAGGLSYWQTWFGTSASTAVSSAPAVTASSTSTPISLITSFSVPPASATITTYQGASAFSIPAAINGVATTLYVPIVNGSSTQVYTSSGQNITSLLQLGLYQQQLNAAISSMGTYGSTPTPITPPIVATTSPTQPGSPSTAIPTTINLQNVSRPGQMQFWVGDQFSLQVMGSPNASVTGDGIQNGVDNGPANFGNTDQSGQLTINSTMTAAQTGNWTETWTVGSGAPATVSFSVVAAPGQLTAQSGVSGVSGLRQERN
jgi:hypothetical protein